MFPVDDSVQVGMHAPSTTSTARSITVPIPRTRRSVLSRSAAGSCPRNRAFHPTLVGRVLMFYAVSVDPICVAQSGFATRAGGHFGGYKPPQSTKSGSTESLFFSANQDAADQSRVETAPTCCSPHFDPHVVTIFIACLCILYNALKTLRVFQNP